MKVSPFTNHFLSLKPAKMQLWHKGTPYYQLPQKESKKHSWLFFKLGFTPLKTEQLQQGIELQGKEESKDKQHTRNIVRERRKRNETPTNSTY